ncbi:DUF6929 family protein [Chitinibacteraceae bacterium HSL-7]
MKLKMLAAALLTMTALNAQADDLELTISSPVLNTELPSASGLTAQGRFLYAVGDDSPYLFELDRHFNITDKLLIKDYPIVNGRIPKAVKPDFEAMTEVRDGRNLWRVVLGSGSKADVREIGYLIDWKSGTKLESHLGALYGQLYAAAGFSGEQELNIEGLTTAGNHAYLFNRGNPTTSNVVFRVSLSEFMAYMKGQRTSVSKVDAFTVKLPNVSSFEAGLSGGDYWPEAGALVYTASVEATGDAYNDGAILGSFVGLINLDDLEAGKVLDLNSSSVPLTRNGRVVITKVESMAIQQRDDEELKGVLVSDNDDGTSEFFNFKLTR